MKRDIYQEVTDRIIAALEEGTVPWRKPWTGPRAIPANLVSGKDYRGTNTIILWATGLAEAYDSGYWMTYRQAASRGGQVRKGEHGTQVIFWKFLEVDDPDAEGGTKRVPFLRCYTVFNLAQIDGIEAPDAPANGHDPIQAAEDLLASITEGPAIRHGGGRACYSVDQDVITMPPPERFDSPAGYYATLIHELIHSTRHESRLDRGSQTREFGDPIYSEEELVAELGAAFVLARLGLEAPVIDNQAAYIASWLKRLSDDKRLLVRAGGRAQKAADWVLRNYLVEGEVQKAA